MVKLFSAYLWTESRPIKTQKVTRPISSHLDLTLGINKGFFTCPQKELFLAGPTREIPNYLARSRTQPHNNCVPTVGNFFTKGLPGGGEFVIYKFFSFYHFETETLCMHKEDSVGQVSKSLKLGAHVIGSLENTSLLLLPIKRVLTSLSTL